MAQRRDSSMGEAIFRLLAYLPWWVCVAAAVLSYLGLHGFTTETIAPFTLDGAVAFAAKTFLKSTAAYLQYIVPFICLLAAATSALTKSKRQALVQSVTANPTIAALNGMSWQEFEMLVGHSFRQKGYKVLELGGGGADGGVDLVLLKGKERFLVQCKQWKAFKVGVDVVRELYGVMTAQGSAGGFVVTSGQFTKDAHEFATGRNLTRMNGAALAHMLGQARTGLPIRPVATPNQGSQAPNCPRCGGAMIKRQARQGASVGSAFWGCANFPRCRGTVPI
jgi:restriction system protein